jgi:hypothetical protein
MTLIIAAAKREFMVVAADGSEFRHFPGQAPFMEVTNRQKLFALPGRSIVLAVHGQNRITAEDAELASQRLVGEILNDTFGELSSIRTVEGVAKKLCQLLTADVVHTFGLLQRCGVHTSALGINVLGFDADEGRSRGWEVFWPMLPDTTEPRVQKLVQEADDVRILHSGTGARNAEAVIRNLRFGYDVNRLKRASIRDAQKYVRGVFRTAVTLQPRDKQEFGGDYFEITITAGRLSHTSPRREPRNEPQ